MVQTRNQKALNDTKSIEQLGNSKQINTLDTKLNDKKSSNKITTEKVPGPNTENKNDGKVLSVNGELLTVSDIDKRLQLLSKMVDVMYTNSPLLNKKENDTNKLGDYSDIDEIFSQLYISKSPQVVIKERSKEKLLVDEKQMCEMMFKPFGTIPEITGLKNALLTPLETKIPIRKQVVFTNIPNLYTCKYDENTTKEAGPHKPQNYNDSKENESGTKIIKKVYDKITRKHETPDNFKLIFVDVDEKNVGILPRSNLKFDCPFVSLQFESALTTIPVGKKEEKVVNNNENDGGIGRTEAFMQYTLDKLLHTVFGLLVSNDLEKSEFFGFDRNKLDLSLTVPGKRPDFVVTFKDMLVFKGEEKKKGKVRTIALELVDKMLVGPPPPSITIPNSIDPKNSSIPKTKTEPEKNRKLKHIKNKLLGNTKSLNTKSRKSWLGNDPTCQIPYLLCYATAGNSILFVAIDKENNMVDCSDILNMESLNDRITTLLILINSVRIIRQLLLNF
ncbi:hypothetical protein BB558_003875 [Smittium angustum]|uniref:Uncharacterized protein n=1 Tax=Smittium angustum TaxID=133377 RepID=A0A2U1J4N8_SMIAN|nr:hypothetical protein BB558_003875 [Smittium angustum]